MTHRQGCLDTNVQNVWADPEDSEASRHNAGRSAPIINSVVSDFTKYSFMRDLSRVQVDIDILGK